MAVIDIKGFYGYYIREFDGAADGYIPRRALCFGRDFYMHIWPVLLLKNCGRAA